MCLCVLQQRMQIKGESNSKQNHPSSPIKVVQKSLKVGVNNDIRLKNVEAALKMRGSFVNVNQMCQDEMRRCPAAASA